MKRRPTQRERALQKQVDQLQDKLDALYALGAQYPGGTHICSEPGIDHGNRCSIKTARRLGRAVFVVSDSNDHLMFYALPQAKD